VCQIIAATPAIYYLNALNDRQSGFSHVTYLQMLQHLHTRYGEVTMDMKDANLACMIMAAWQPPTPIDSLFQQLDVGIYFAEAAQEPLVDFDSTVARLGYNICSPNRPLHQGLPQMAPQTRCLANMHTMPPSRNTSVKWTAVIAGSIPLPQRQLATMVNPPPIRL
jgi:hypothetical protein